MLKFVRILIISVAFLLSAMLFFDKTFADDVSNSESTSIANMNGGEAGNAQTPSTTIKNWHEVK